MKTEIEKKLSVLGFNYLAKNSADFCATLTKKKLSPFATLELIAQLEMEERLNLGIQRRVKVACLGRYRPLCDFDWLWPKKIDKAVIDGLMSMKFVIEPFNVIIFGSSGVGKTMIAKNLAYHATLAGHTALFTEASEMLSDLERQESPRLLKLRLAKYIRPKVLVIDEIGYLSYTNRAADLLFQVITRRHEKTSTIITTNVAFKDWGNIFPGAACMVALLDRLTHRAEVISIEADSYRKKESMEKKRQRSKVDTCAEP